MIYCLQRSLIFTATAALLIGCGGGATEQNAAGAATDQTAADAATDQVAADAEKSRTGDLASDDVAYMTRLGLIRGHLLAGVTLYRQGALQHASSHMKHPGDELYAGLDAAFQARGTEGFAGQLEALASAVEQQKDVQEVDAAYQQLLDGIERAEYAVAPAFAVDMSGQRAVIQGLLEPAATEYGIGVTDGRVVDVHEYQDAWGFTQTALARARKIAAEKPDAWDPVVEAIESLQPLWPALTPEGDISADADAFARAIAAITPG